MDHDFNQFFVPSLNEFHFNLDPSLKALPVRCVYDEQALELRSKGAIEFGQGIRLSALKKQGAVDIPVLRAKLSAGEIPTCSFEVNGELLIPRSRGGGVVTKVTGQLKIRARGEQLEVVDCAIGSERPAEIVLPGNIKLSQAQIKLSYSSLARIFSVSLTGKLSRASQIEFLSGDGRSEAVVEVRILFNANDANDIRVETTVRNVRMSALKEFEIFDGEIKLTARTKPVLPEPHGRLVLKGGKAGLLRTKSAEPSSYYLNLEDVGAEFDLNNDGFVATLTSGRLRLPRMFEPLTPGLCPNPGDGPAVALTQASRLRLTYRTALAGPGNLSLATEGALRFSNIGFSVPQAPGLSVQLCSADLSIEKGRFPMLVNVSGKMLIPLIDRTAQIDLRDGRFSLDGFPSMRLELGKDLEIYNQDGFAFTLLGVNNRGCVDTQGRIIGAGLTVFPAAAGTLPRVQFDGAIKLTVPTGDLTDENGNQLTCTVCGSLVITPKEDRAPELSMTLGTIAIGGTFRLGGKSGVVIKEANLIAQGIENFFKQSEAMPCKIVLTGKILVPNGPAFGLKEAMFVFTDLQLPPRFIPGTVIYEEHEFALAKKLPLRVAKTELTFKDGTKSLPQLIEPQNLTITVSASVSIPRDDPYFEARVDNVVVTFKSDGSPEFKVGGIGLTIGGLDISPIEGIGGSVYLGGLDRLESLFFAGSLEGSYDGYKVGVLLAFNLKGPIGLAVDFNAGAVGIPIDAWRLGGILLTGGSGGLSLVNSNEDPCAFTTYLDDDGRPKSSPGNFPVAPMTWQELREFVERKKRALQVLGAPPPLPLPGVGAGPSSSGTLVNIRRTPPLTNELGIPCPGDCPPPTINIFCQPHPDQTTFPNLVIAKFSSFDEPTLNRLGITEDWIRKQLEAPVDLLSEIVKRLRAEMKGLLPRASTNTGKAAEINQLLDQSLNAVESRFAVQIKNLISTKATARDIYNAIRDAAYRGAPCPDVTLKVTGTMTHQYISSFLSCTGGAIISTAGSAGIMGNLNLLGLPVGKLRGFISATDSKGDPNPSLCGQVDFEMGPLYLGTLRTSFECDGCVTALLNELGDLAACLTEDLARKVIARVLPQLDTRQLNKQQMLNALKSSKLKMIFIAELLSLSDNQQQRECFMRSLRDSLKAVNPEVLLCGQVHPKLFGFPMGGEVAAASARFSKQDIIASIQCSPSTMISLAFRYLAADPVAATALEYFGLFVQDRALLNFRLELPSIDRAVLDTVEGKVRSRADVLQRTEESIDFMLENGVYAMKYELSPLGFKTLDAQWRVLIPDFLNHPARHKPSRWTMPEKRGERLPSRVEVLIAALDRGRLSDPRWNGNARDFAEVFPKDDPRRERVRGLSAQDYFPHGGHVGAAKLQMPRALAEAAAPELFTIFNENATIKDRLEAAYTYIKDHILKDVPAGSLSFYLPAPNPPMFVDERGQPLSPRKLMEAMNRFDFSNIALQALYPSELLFLRGYFEGSLLGFSLGKAEIIALPPDPPSRPIGCFRVKGNVPQNSWLNQLVDQASLEFEMKQSPSRSIKECFEGLFKRRNQLPADGKPLGDFFTRELLPALKEGLPKVSLEAEVEVRLAEGHVLKSFVQMEKPPNANTNAKLFAFSPSYDSDSVGTSVVGRARRTGGIALQISRLKLGGGRLGFEANIDNAELSITPVGPGQPPRLAGKFENVDLKIGGAFRIPGAALSLNSHPAASETHLTATIPSLQMGRFIIHGAGGMSSPVTLRIDQTGVKVASGSKLTVQGMSISSLSVDQLTIRADGSFEISADGLTINTPEFQLTSSSVTLRHAQGTATLSLNQPRLKLSSVAFPSVELPAQPVSIASTGVWECNSGLQTIEKPDMFTLRAVISAGMDAQLKPYVRLKDAAFSVPRFRIERTALSPTLTANGFTVQFDNWRASFPNLLETNAGKWTLSWQGDPQFDLWTSSTQLIVLGKIINTAVTFRCKREGGSLQAFFEAPGFKFQSGSLFEISDCHCELHMHRIADSLYFSGTGRALKSNEQWLLQGGAQLQAFSDATLSGQLYNIPNATVGEIPNVLSLKTDTKDIAVSFERTADGHYLRFGRLKLELLGHAINPKTCELKDGTGNLQVDWALQTFVFGPLRLQASGFIQFNPAQPQAAKIHFNDGLLTSDLPDSASSNVPAFDLSANGSFDVPLPNLRFYGVSFNSGIYRLRRAGGKVQLEIFDEISFKQNDLSCTTKRRVIVGSGGLEFKASMSVTDSFQPPSTTVKVPVTKQEQRRDKLKDFWGNEYWGPEYTYTWVEWEDKTISPDKINVRINFDEVTMTYNSAQKRFEATVQKNVQVQENISWAPSYRLSIGQDGLTIMRN